jgi:hypothetical protein
MSQRKAKWDDVVWEPDGQTVNVEDTQFMRVESGEPKVPYLPCPSPDAKWKALLAVATMPGWNGTMKGVMACLISCANYYSGKCCPSQKWIAKKLECTERAVSKGIDKLKELPCLRVLARNEPGSGEWDCNGYIIGWRYLIERCHLTFPETRRNERSVSEERTFQARTNERSRKPIEEELIERTYKHKVVHPPSAADTTISFLNEKEGFQERESVADSAPYPQTPCSRESKSESDAYAAVSGYCTAFDWEHLSEEDFAAAVAAEMTQVGSGLAVVNAATQEAWRAKRRKEQ